MKCHYCGIKLDDNNWTKDHRTARALGGSDDQKNLVNACKQCNNEKSTLESWLVNLFKGLKARKSKTYHNQFYTTFRRKGLDFYIQVWIRLYTKYNSIVPLIQIEHLLYESELNDIIRVLDSHNIPYRT